MSTFDRRRRLTRQDLLSAAGAAVGAGIGVAIVTFYAVRLMLQREPLRPLPGPVPVPPAGPGVPAAPGEPAVATAAAPLPSTPPRSPRT